MKNNAKKYTNNKNSKIWGNIKGKLQKGRLRSLNASYITLDIARKKRSNIQLIYRYDSNK